MTGHFPAAYKFPTKTALSQHMGYKGPWPDAAVRRVAPAAERGGIGAADHDRHGVARSLDIPPARGGPGSAARGRAAMEATMFTGWITIT